MNELPMVCDYHKRDNEPCYGEIQSIIDGEYWLTFCEGHQAVINGGAYVPKDPIRRIIFSKQNSRIRELEAENEELKIAIQSQIIDKLMLQHGHVREIEIPDERLKVLE